MRRRRSALKVVKEFDAFPKVEDDYQESTARGGTISVISLTLIAILVISEFFYYLSTDVHYKYSVNTDMDSKVLLTVDMTVATPCEYLGADIIDLAGESKTVSGAMKMESAVFKLTEEQIMYLKAKRKLANLRLDNVRALIDLPIIEGAGREMPGGQGDSGDALKPDSCRLHGSMDVKRVAANFHVTMGRSIPHPQGHAHLNVFIPKDMLNFSHRIDHLSFGPPVPGAINPLDATLKITHDKYHLFQYYMQVVPTKFSTYHHSVSTNQYSVSERNRTINHQKGSHGAAGVFFKYDMNSMMVEIVEERKPFGQFLVRLCGIIGGIFATSGMLNAFIGSLTDGVISRLLGRKHPDSVSRDHASS